MIYKVFFFPSFKTPKLIKLFNHSSLSHFIFVIQLSPFAGTLNINNPTALLLGPNRKQINKLSSHFSRFRSPYPLSVSAAATLPTRTVTERAFETIVGTLRPQSAAERGVPHDAISFIHISIYSFVHRSIFFSHNPSTHPSTH